MLIRPESLHVGHEGVAAVTPGTNAVTGLVRRADFAGAHTELVVDVNGVMLQSQAHAFDEVFVDSPVTLTVDAQWVVALGETDDVGPGVAPRPRVADRAT
jgi:hypothetical protein